MLLKFENKAVLIGFFLAFLGTALFALKSIFIKLAYQQGLNTDSVLMLRMAVSLPIYLVVLFYLVKRSTIPSDKIKSHFPLILFLGFIGYFLASWLDLKGLETISAGLERLTLFTYPIFVALLGALFFDTPLSKKIMFTLALTYSGLWIVFSEEIKLSSGDDIAIGVTYVVLSALSFSFYVLFGKQVIKQLGSLWFTTIAMSISSVFVLVFYGFTTNFDLLVVTNEAWFWIVLLAIFSTVLPSFMISEAIHKIGPAQTGIVGTLGPIITIFLAVIILDEPFGIHHAIGVALVMIGVSLLTVKTSTAVKIRPE